MLKALSITSLSNPKIKAAVRLQNGRERRYERKFLIDGIREIDRAISSGFTILELFVLEKSSCSPNMAEKLNGLLKKTEQKRIPTCTVTKPVFEKLAFGQRFEGVVAVAETREYSWNELKLSEPPLVAVLETLEKPGNLGAVLRTADGAGVEAVIVADPLCDVYNPNTIRASLGTIFSVPVIVDNSANVISELRKRKISIAAARCEGSICYTEFDFRQASAIVLGAEADGLSDAWHGNDIQSVRLPMCGIADSLNVSNAAAVLFYEAHRQRHRTE
ncbi:MAG: TrmH family RNA methyltransferase [Thermoguttaceae bacterium]